MERAVTKEILQIFNYVYFTNNDFSKVLSKIPFPKTQKCFRKFAGSKLKQRTYNSSRLLSFHGNIYDF